LRNLAPLFFAFAGANAMRCGPTPEEAGSAVLMASPLVLGFGLLLVWVLWQLWRRVQPDLPLDVRPGRWTLAAVSALAVVGLATGGEKAFEWVGLALWLFGASYVALTLVTLRIWLHLRRETAFTWAAVPPILLMVAPALVLCTGLAGGLMDASMALWMYPGFGGWIASPLFLLLLLEAALRGRRPPPSGG
jgi:hypothetical protein